MGRVTISDVASRAGVSTSTVSRTLHDNPRISPETKERVLAAARELGYQGAAAVAEGVKSVGLLLPTPASELLHHPFFVQVMRGVSLLAQANGFLTTYAFGAGDSEQVEVLERFVSSTAVSGVILLAVRSGDRCVDLLAESGTPFSVIGRPRSANSLLWVDNDNFHAMYDAVNLLVEQGAREIAFVGGPAEMVVTSDRLEGYRRALANRGLRSDASLVFHAREFGRPAGYEAMRMLLEAGRPEAFVATDDYLALGALDYLRDHGTRMPCVSFNNSREARDADPPLSSVEINPEELGRQAARLVLASINGEDPGDRHVIVPTSLIQRQSSALALA